ncbi:hypothetical protein KP509_33G021500 [Ceratopteris richardii]|uniref:Uncharacterized protein n=1 Tax=Ceratopteris richardii TaxID=49495 RepID=A0A8T2QP01_CERRI|nr:hypothetical protein KP509_33G021500 [Ceratopteris richardii]
MSNWMKVYPKQVSRKEIFEQISTEDVYGASSKCKITPSWLMESAAAHYLKRRAGRSVGVFVHTKKMGSWFEKWKRWKQVRRK